MRLFWEHWNTWLWPAGVLAGSILLALAVYYVTFAIGNRLTKRSSSIIVRSLLEHAKGPARWIFPLLSVDIALPVLPVRSELVETIRHVVGLGVIAATAWVIILLAEVVSDAIYARHSAAGTDDLTARRVRTQTTLLRRIFTMVVVIITAGIMLMTFPQIRAIGASLLASAGLAGLVVGVAMKPTFSDLVAGLQIAFTEPIRIDDVVIVEGEWGWIEEILTTYVVVRTWDLRRLVVPLSYFISHPFQNWTRRTADLLAYVYVYCDYTAPIEELRAEFRYILESTPLWDGKVCVLQVTDASQQTVQIRALTSAADSSKAWDLRCYVREKLIRFLQDKHPDSLPKTRTELRGMRNNGTALLGAAAAPGKPNPLSKG